MPSSIVATGHAFERGAAFNGSVDSNCSMASSPANFRKRSKMFGVGTGVAFGRKMGLVAAAAGLKSIKSTPSRSSGSLDRGLQVSFWVQVTVTVWWIHAWILLFLPSLDL